MRSLYRGLAPKWELMQMNWTVDYGDGPIPVQVPHVWHGQVPVSWEGPAEYRTEISVPLGQPHLVFWGVSYRAEIWVGNSLLHVHEGIWDAFAVDLSPWQGQRVEIRVRVKKNGGRSFPVKQVASGFLPYVYQTFGGIFREVELLDGPPQLEPAAHVPTIHIDGNRIIANGEPFYGRGILTWGWYPETSSPHPAGDVIERETDQIKSLGFNIVKFCLWLPPHEYLRSLHRKGIWAWIELPIWLPETDTTSQQRMRDEALRIAKQYRHHPNILAWTAGCELSEGIDPNWRRTLVEDLHEITGHPLIKDNSGGAEMYGGHPEEFGDFDDFHPYCEPMFFSGVLENLSAGPRTARPTLLGEFNDYDVFRPLQKLADNPPYWASDNPELNEQGVRWQYDLPRILKECRETDLGTWLESRSAELQASSLSQGAWMRLRAFDATRFRGDFSGWILTGHRHTPISSSGILDDVNELVYAPEIVKQWTGDLSVMLFPRRTPPWVDGGNRPGWEPTTVRFTGPCQFQVAAHSVNDVEGELTWDISGGVHGRCSARKVSACDPTAVGEFVVELLPGMYTLNFQFANVGRSFPIRVVSPLETMEDDRIFHNSGTISRPFFREACYAFEHPIWEQNQWKDAWEMLALVASDKVLDSAKLDQEYSVWSPLLVRLDTRTFERLPVVVFANGKIITSLNLEGGLGDQPIGRKRNPAAHSLFRLFQDFLLEFDQQ